MAKRMEIGAVIGASKRKCNARYSEDGDVIVLLVEQPVVTAAAVQPALPKPIQPIPLKFAALKCKRVIPNRA